jgi:pyridoxamine 5'-phosphate oxidase
MSQPPSSFSPDLAELHAEIWRMLGRGAADAKDDLHWPGFTTVNAQHQPQSRIVVLRAARPSERELEIHTDARSLKVQELRHQPQASLLFYRPRSRAQIRVQAVAQLHHGNDVARQRWQALGEAGQTLYCSSVTPGSTLESPEQALTPALTQEQGLANFVVITLQVQRLEWLELARPVHRRACFNYSTAPHFQAQWIAP